ncbi:MAG: putative lipid II flippase FtsW [Synergistaceae bacterium]|jgi:cell division protein FtsW|nr:putative lipid II flippase FtsW [Synergistaceae bacterium]
MAEPREGQHVQQRFWLLWMIPMLLSLMGIVMIASLTSRGGKEGYGLTLRQIHFLGIGFFFMCCCYLTPLRLVRNMSGFLWLAAVLMVFATLIPGIGVRVGGARRWLNLGFVQFQPLELLTVAVPLFLADRLEVSRRENIQGFFRPSFLLALLSSLPLYLQPNMGGIVLVFAICMSMHVVARGWKYPLLGGMLLLGVFVAMIFLEPYRMRRLLAFLDPWEDPMGKGFQIIQGLVAFSNGGILGVGVGKGLQKMNYLPAAHTDYIFPAIGEEFGLVGTAGVMLFYALWTWKSWRLYRRADSLYASVLIWGLTASILFPMFVNVGGVMKLMPLTGVPLPFVSAGGSALVFMWIKVGFLMRLAREINARSASGASSGERAAKS